MSLACITPLGKGYIADQKVAMSIVAKHKPNWGFVHTPTVGVSPIDTVGHKNDEMKAAFEVKSRNMTYAELMTKFRGEWLITDSKVQEAIDVASGLDIPLWGVLYLKPDNTVLTVQISDKDGNIVCDSRSDETQTQATCNGGRAVRLNKFIDMTCARIYR